MSLSNLYGRIVDLIDGIPCLPGPLKNLLKLILSETTTFVGAINLIYTSIFLYIVIFGRRKQRKN